MLDDVTKKRCSWVGDNPLMLQYHDREWGVPVHDDRKHFEFLVLEAAQAGLSWTIVLKKREGYRRAFDGFEPEKVARYSARRISRDFLGFKPIESAPIAFPLLQYNRPAQPGLRSFKHEKFKVLAVIVDGDTPLAIMILEHQRIISDPGASFLCHIVEHRGFLLTFGRSWLVWMQS